MDLSKLTTGDQVVGVSGIVLFIFSFFSWLGVDVTIGGLGTYGSSASAWSFTLPLLAVLLGVLAVVGVVLKAAGVAMPEMGMTHGMRQLVIGAVALAFVLIKTVTGVGGLPDGVSTSRGIGLWVGLIACIGLTVGGYLTMQGEKSSGSSIPPAA